MELVRFRVIVVDPDPFISINQVKVDNEDQDICVVFRFYLNRP